jgi:hypothetical protein
MKKLITFILALIGVYALCSLIIWNINIEFWPWWMRAIFVFWGLIILSKSISSK